MSILNDEATINIWDNRLMKLFFDCHSDESACEKIKTKFNFYNAIEFQDLHCDSFGKKGKEDFSSLRKIDLIPKNMKPLRVVPLDKKWLGIILCDKKSEQPVTDRAVYISSEGFCYLTDDIEALQNGCVPDYVYFKEMEKSLYAFVLIDEKYFDGNHKEFVENVYNAYTKVLLGFLSNIIEEKLNSVEDAINFYESDKAKPIRDVLYFLISGLDKAKEIYDKYHKKLEQNTQEKIDY